MTTKLMNKTDIEKAIKSIEGRGLTLDKSIQQCAVSIAAHVEQHGEVSLAIKLYNAMPKGSRAVALAHWFNTFTKVSVNEDKKASKEFPFVYNKVGKTDIPLGEATPWFDCKKPKGTLAEQFDFEGGLKAFQARIKKAVEAGTLQEDARIAQILSLPVDAK